MNLYRGLQHAVIRLERPQPERCGKRADRDERLDSHSKRTSEDLRMPNTLLLVFLGVARPKLESRPMQA